MSNVEAESGEISYLSSGRREASSGACRPEIDLSCSATFGERNFNPKRVRELERTGSRAEAEQLLDTLHIDERK
jgi:hypothetical protein